MNRSRVRNIPYTPQKEWRLITSTEWTNLEEQLRSLRLEPGTKNNYETGYQAWRYFCNLYSISNPIPTQQTLIQFITQLALLNYPHKTIITYLTGIGSWMSLLGHKAEWDIMRTNPSSVDLLVAVRKRTGILFPSSVRRKRPLSESHLNFLSSTTTWGSSNDTLFTAIIFIGFFGLLRLGELCSSDDHSLQNFTKMLLRSDIAIDDTQICVQICFMKNDRFYEGSTIRIQHLPALYDPVTNIKRYLLMRDMTHGAKVRLFLLDNGTIPSRHSKCTTYGGMNSRAIHYAQEELRG